MHNGTWIRGYPRNVDCRWHVRALHNHFLNVTVLDAQVNGHFNGTKHCSTLYSHFIIRHANGSKTVGGIG